MKYKVVFLDWYGTLSTSKFWGHLERSIHDKIETSLFGNLKIADSWMRGEFLTENVIEKLAEDTKLGYEMLLTEFVKSCESMKFISDDTDKLVLKLRKKGVKVFIATDNMDSFTRWTVPAMKLDKIFDGVLNSHNLKALKKDFKAEKSLFFEKFLKDNKIKPGESIIIDDAEDRERKIERSGIVYKRIIHGEGITKELLELI